MKNPYYVPAWLARRAAGLSIVFCIAASARATAPISVVEWSFAGIPTGETTDIEASYCCEGLTVSTLTEAGGTNHIGIVTFPAGSNEISDSTPFTAPAYEVGMTTTLGDSGFSLDFNLLINAGSCVSLSELSFDLGYDHNYTLPGNQYYAPQASLQASTNGAEWIVIGQTLTPAIDDVSEFNDQPGGAYYIDASMSVDLTSLGPLTEGTRIYFRLKLAETPESASDRRRILIDNLKLEGIVTAENIQNIIVFHNADEFAGWPANGGLWMWDDEMVVGFERWTYEPNPEDRHHATTPFIAYYYSRSTDGGLTWSGEAKPPKITPASSYDFSESNFAIRLWKENLFFSDNRAETWGGPVALPKIDGLPNYARSNYIITGTNSALLFISTDATTGAPARSYVASLTNQAVSFLSWVGNDLLDHAHTTPAADPYTHSIMPSAVKIEAGHYVCAVRQRIDNDRWSDVYESLDHGKTWRYISELEQDSDNPISLVALGGDTIAAIYGWRLPPYGLRAKISYNAGRTWSDEIVLRDDGLNDDIGHTRAVARPDGAIAILYYYSTEDLPQQHIAATIWRPRGTGIIKNNIVYHAADEFAGWPANGGLWMWDDEMVVGFERWTYDPAPDDRHYAQTPFIAYYYSRSLDGGLTWSGEAKPPNITPASSYDFSESDFAIRLWKENIFFSDNRAETWGGPVALPKIDGLPNYARSNYIITGTNSALLFISTDATTGAPARSYVASLTNQAVSFLSWVGNDLLDHAHTTPAADPYNHSIMPAAVRINDGHYVCAVRQRIDNDRWSDVYGSLDHGKTWCYISELERGSDNPVSLVLLEGDTIAAIYGWRLPPYGLRAKISYNAGETWSEELILRDDGLNDDIGYTRAVVRKDGAVVILYYYATADHPEQHIAVTVWRPTGTSALSDSEALTLALGLDLDGILPPYTSFTENGLFKLTFYAARAYANYQVDVSPDLLHWEPVSIPNAIIPGYISVTNATIGKSGFMRLRATFTP